LNRLAISATHNVISEVFYRRVNVSGTACEERELAFGTDEETETPCFPDAFVHGNDIQRRSDSLQIVTGKAGYHCVSVSQKHHQRAEYIRIAQKRLRLLVRGAPPPQILAVCSSTSIKRIMRVS
jgi:hypothetical protein